MYFLCFYLDVTLSIRSGAKISGEQLQYSTSNLTVEILILEKYEMRDDSDGDVGDHWWLKTDEYNRYPSRKIRRKIEIELYWVH